MPVWNKSLMLTYIDVGQVLIEAHRLSIREESADDRNWRTMAYSITVVYHWAYMSCSVLLSPSGWPQT